MSEHTDIAEIPLDAVSSLENRLGRKFTKKQRQFLDAYFSDGDMRKAADEAGYSNRGEIYAWFRKLPGINGVISDEILTQIHEGALEGALYMRKVLSDPKAPHSAKNDAAKALMNRDGVTEHKPKAGGSSEARDLSEMSPAELAATIGMLQAQLEKKGAKPPIEGQFSPVAGTPEYKPTKNQ